MRLRIQHETRYSYGLPAISAIQILRLTPRNNAHQYVRNWRIDVSSDARLRRLDDPFGNVAHYLTVDGPIEEVVISAVGEVETDDASGVLEGTLEKLPPELYLRRTPPTEPSGRIMDFARSASQASDGTALDIAHVLAQRVHEEIQFDPTGSTVTTPASEVLENRRGVCQDLTHLYLSAARGLGIPARYVSGYMYDAVSQQPFEAGHAWAEIHVPALGWVGFDPTAGVAPTDAYVRMAIGLDYLGAAPVRGARNGGADEELVVRLWVNRSDRPGRTQSQTLGDMTQTQTDDDGDANPAVQSQSQQSQSGG